MNLSLARVARLIDASGGFDGEALANGYSIDSRTLAPGDLFFAVKGERLDGHDFVEVALARGAVAAIVRNDQLSRYADKKKLIPVDDTLSALQSLATGVRKLWGKPLIAVTGSAGKTTTKDAIAHLLTTRFHVLKSQGNLNNQFGLPLQLLKLGSEYDVAVIEMGMNHAGEITALARIAQPDVGVVTLVAPVHLEFFESIAAIARAKKELIDSLPPAGTAVLNADDEYVSQLGRDFKGKIVTFAMNCPADVRTGTVVENGILGSGFEIIAHDRSEKASLHLLGRHNIYNALAAVAVALEQGVPLREAAQALATLAPPDKRGEILKLGEVTVINDCYNSNPKALYSVVEALAKTPARRRIVVAGEMLELGRESEELHRASGRHIAERKIDVLLGVRGLAREMVKAAQSAGTQAEFVESPKEAGEWLARNTRAGDVVLLKASRGVKLEGALETWRVLTVAAGHQQR